MTYSCSTGVFFPYAAVVLIGRRRAHFLMRLSDQAAGFAKRLRSLGPQDWEVRFTPSRERRRLEPWLPQEIPARLIRYHVPGFRPSWLLTSLQDTETYARTELIDLYHRRWGIETIYREWKHDLDIQNLRAHTPIGIKKEIHGQILLSNLVRWLMTEATAGTPLEPVDLSFRAALTHVEAVLPILGRTRASQVLVIYRQLLDDIRRTRIRKRPGRSYPRPVTRGQRRRKPKKCLRDSQT